MENRSAYGVTVQLLICAPGKVYYPLSFRILNVSIDTTGFPGTRVEVGCFVVCSNEDVARFFVFALLLTRRAQFNT